MKQKYQYWTILILTLVVFGATYFAWSKNQPPVDLLNSAISTESPIEAEKQKPEEFKISELKMLIVGDIMLDRNVFRKTIVEGGGNYEFPFLNLGFFFEEEYDYRMANLEGPITPNKSVVSPANLQFTFSPDYLDYLEKYFNIFSLANNHTNNFGKKGLEQTRNYLAEKNILYFGDAYNSTEYLSKIIEQAELKIGLIGFNQFANDGFDRVLNEIKILKPQVDLVFVFPHWGIEYQSVNPGAKQKEQARQIIDAGADAIIGGHPHVIQPIEIYNGRPIFYSLGNFIFDQYFSKETMAGLAIAITVTKADNLHWRIDLMPIKINANYQPELASADYSQKMLEFLAQNSWVIDEQKNEIMAGYLNFEQAGYLLELKKVL